MRNFPALLLALLTPSLHAATLSCPGSNLGPYTTTGYSFELNPAATGATPTTTLTAQVPLDASYLALFQITLEGANLAKCTLTDGSATLTLEEVLFSDLKVLSGNFYTLYTPGPVVQIVANVGRVEIQTGS